jgi:L-iditol 2-dehydrogenase
MSATEGALLETLGVAMHAVNLGHLRLADRVAVLGVGPVGLLIARLARLSGAVQVFVTDCNPTRLAAAQALGVDAAIDIRAEEPVAALRQLTGGRGVDVAFEAAGALETPQQAVEMLRPGGTVVLVGICPDDRIPLTSTSPRRKGITIKLSRRMKHVYPRAIALAQHGLVDVLPLLTHRFSLDQTAEAFERLANGAVDTVKVVVESEVTVGKTQHN